MVETRRVIGLEDPLFTQDDDTEVAGVIQNGRAYDASYNSSTPPS